MNSLLMLVLLLAVVFVLLIFPVRKRRIRFDEKGEAIKIYHEEVAYIERQLKKGFIDSKEEKQLLLELDKKTALAITAIEEKSFSYQRSFTPLLVIVAGLALASTFYFWHYQKNGVMRWQFFNEQFQGRITEGLFDERVVTDFVLEYDDETSAAYCFAMQHELLEKYDRSPDALANLAACFLQVGYPQLAEQAVQRGVNSDAKHLELNYLLTELAYGKNKQLNSADIDRLLAIIKQQPDHFKAIRLLAINSLNQKHYLQAKFFFTRLKQLAPKDNAELSTALNRLLGEIETEIAKAAPTPLSPHVLPHVQTQANSQATNAQQNTKKDTAKSAEQQAKLTVSISITPTLAKQLDEENTLFVIVKSREGQLLTASKHQFSAAQQPLSLTLSDNQAGAMQMQPMAGHDAVEVVARISRNHTPIANSGDLSSAALMVTLPQEKTPELLIDRVLP